MRGIYIDFMEKNNDYKIRSENYWDALEKRLVAAEDHLNFTQQNQVMDIVNRILGIKKTMVETWPKVVTTKGEIQRLSQLNEKTK